MKNVKLQIKMQNLNVGTVGAPLVGALNPHPGTETNPHSGADLEP